MFFSYYIINHLQGPIGATGPIGQTGATGATGPAGSDATLSYADFYALMPPDNSATVARGAGLIFRKTELRAVTI